MNISNYIIVLVFSIALASCEDKKEEKGTNEIAEVVQPDIAVDHFNIWVKNPEKAKAKLTEIGFTPIPDSLSMIHAGQGTSGRFFYFLNTYLEFIFIYDQNEFDANNKKNQELDFIERANFSKNGASPFGLALKIKEYAVEKIPFKKIQYHQDWMHENSAIYAAQNSKKNLKEPSVFVMYPEIEYDTFETIADLKNIPDEYALWRTFYKHPNGAKKVSKIMITCDQLNTKSETIKTFDKIDNVTIKKGSEPLMELYFDDKIQNKTFDLRPDLPLIVYL